MHCLQPEYISDCDSYVASERRLGNYLLTQLYFLCGLGQIIFLCLSFLSKGKCRKDGNQIYQREQ